VRRLLALVFGLAVAAAALYALLSDGEPARVGSKTAKDEIDDASRAKLERVLEQSDARGGD